MTRREQLQEQYEDALFALLMDDLTVTEGKAAIEENERLKNDPDYTVPLKTRNRCLKTISRCCMRRTLGSAGKVLYRGFSKVAVIGMICMLLFTTAFAASSSFRANTLNFMMEVFDDRTEIRFIDPNSVDNDFQKSCKIVANWLPEGYTLTEQVEDAFLSSACYSSESGEGISIDVFKGENGVLNIDTEDAQSTSVMVHGCPGLLVLKDGTVQLVWGNEKDLYKVYIVAEGTEDEDIQNLFKIAENLAIEVY